MKAKTQDKIFHALMLFCSLLVIGLLLVILGFVGYKGIGLIDWHFLTGDFYEDTEYVTVSDIQDMGIEVDSIEHEGKNYIRITSVEKDSPVTQAVCGDGEVWPIKKGDLIRKVDKTDVRDYTVDEYNEVIAGMSGSVRLKMIRPGEGIFPLILNTLALIGLSLLISMPVSIFSAIYLAEYSKDGLFIRIIRFTTGCLAGIPSIIFGLFGMLVFVIAMKLTFSLIAGALTLAVVLLPTIITQTEEAIRRVPRTFREGSLALGATKLQTIFKVILPNALSGITIAVLLSVGRIVAESAALILTAGTIAAVPENIFGSASTLTVTAYNVAMETGDIELACAMGIVTIILIIIVNSLVKVTERFDKMKDFK